MREPLPPSSIAPAAYAKASDKRRSKIQKDNQKALLAHCADADLLGLCGGDHVTAAGALYWLCDQLRGEPGLLAQARAKGMAVTAWYEPEVSIPEVIGLQISLRSPPTPSLAAQIEEDGFVCLTSEGQRPIVYAGTGDLATYRLLITRPDLVLRYDPPCGIRGPAPTHSRTAQPCPSAGPLPCKTDHAAADAGQTTRMGGDVAHPPAPAYALSVIQSPPGHLLHEAASAEIDAAVEAVVKAEGPVHEEQVIRRIRTGYGQSQAGERSRRVIEHAMDRLIMAGRITRSGTFLHVTGSPVQVRDRAGVDETLRQHEHLPPAEIDLALIQQIAFSGSSDEEEVVTGVAARLGYRLSGQRLMGSKVGAVIRERLRALSARSSMIGDIHLMPHASDEDADVAKGPAVSTAEQGLFVSDPVEGCGETEDAALP